MDQSIDRLVSVNLLFFYFLFLRFFFSIFFIATTQASAGTSPGFRVWKGLILRTGSIFLLLWLVAATNKQGY